jgi:predicted nucleic acid-binding protein
LRYVLDCSVAVRWFVPQIHAEHALRFLETLHARENVALAPDIIVSELGHVLRKLAVGKRLSRQRAELSLERFLALGLDLVPSVPLAPTALSLALRHSGTFYDALYLALAEREAIPVLTADERMVSAFSPLVRTVHLADLPR